MSGSTIFGATLRRAAAYLGLAAAPTFAVMAVLGGAVDNALPSALCGGARGMSPLGGMMVMYLLMSAFHSACWLKLVSRRHHLHTSTG